MSGILSITLEPWNETCPDKQHDFEYYFDRSLLALCYIILLGLGVAALTRQFRKFTLASRSLRNVWQKWFFVVFLLACIGRVTDMIYGLALSPGSQIDPDTGQFTWWLRWLPTYLFMSDYTIVLACWMMAYHQVHSFSAISDKRKPYFEMTSRISLFETVLLMLNVFLYVSFLILWILDMFVVASSQEYLVVWTNLSIQVVVYAGLSFGYAVYGILITSALSPNRNVSPAARTVFRRVVPVSVICTLCFATRAVQKGLMIPYHCLYWSIPYFDPVYYICLEILPLVLMLLSLHQNRKVNKHMSYGDAGNVNNP